MFTEQFDEHVCEGDGISVEVDGFTLTARIEHDGDCHIDDDDYHSEDQNVTGCDDEQFAELLAARKAWFDDEWFYCGVVVSVSKNSVVLDKHAASLWGIEANYPGQVAGDSYLTTVANELVEEALERGKAVLATL